MSARDRGRGPYDALLTEFMENLKMSATALPREPDLVAVCGKSPDRARLA